MVSYAISVWTQKVSSDIMSNNKIVADVLNKSVGTPIDLSDITKDSTNPQISIDASGNAIVVWNSEYTKIKAIYYTKSSNTWSSVIDISSADQTVSEPQIKMNAAGDAIATWKNGTGVNTVIQSSYYTNGNTWASGWSSVQNLSDSSENAAEQKAGINALGNAIVVWRRNNGSNYIIQATYYTKSTNAWSTVTDLSDVGEEAYNPQITMNSTGNAIAIWSRSDGSNNIVQARYYTNGSAWTSAWSDVIDLSEVGQNANVPQVIMNSYGNAIAIWKRSNGTNDIIQATKYTDGLPWLSGWSVVSDLSGSEGTASSPELTMNDSNKAVAIWTWFNTTTFDNYVQSSTTSGLTNTWTEATNLTSGESPEYPKVVMDVSGNALSVWGILLMGGSAVVQLSPNNTSITTLSPTDVNSGGIQIAVINSGLNPTPPKPDEILVTQAYVDSTTFPVTVTGTKTVKLMEDVTTYKIMNFIFPSGSIVTFDGQGHTVTINNNGEYPGLIASASNDTIVKNVGVLSKTSSLGADKGWIGSYNFLGIIDTCYSNGSISKAIYTTAAFNPFVIAGTAGLYALPDIKYYNVGGIVGSDAGSGAGNTCYVRNCYSTGNIYNSSGIVGNNAGSNSGYCSITNCYSTGNIMFATSSGIVGDYAGSNNGSCIIDRCYYAGVTSSAIGSGIVGLYAGKNGSCKVSNCYTVSNSSISINISGPNTGNYIETNCKFTNTWIDSTANTVIGNNKYVKVSPSSVTNVPYKLASFLYNAVPSLTGTTLTYSSIWPLPSNTANTYIVDDNGNRISSAPVTINSTSRVLTIPGVNASPTPTLYSLVINGNYIDRFELVGNYVVRISITADYYTVIVNAAANSAFKASVKQSVATTLNISASNVTVLGLSPGSILAEIYIPADLIAQLKAIVTAGDLTVTYNDVTYQVKSDYFVVIDDICFHKDTLILTPRGYKKVQELRRGDLVKTAQGREVTITRMTSFVGTQEKCPLHVMYKDSLAPNVPIQDLYMSGGHAFYNNGVWRHMKCSELATKLEVDNIEYYNIVLDNYMENTLVANGVEVESLFDMNGLKMHWRCEEKCCKPIIERA